MKYARVKYNNEIYYGIVDDGKVTLLDGDIFDYYSITDIVISLDDVRLLPPCEPSKIVAVGLNYADHAGELNLKIPEFPALFMKPSSSIIGQNDSIICPPMSKQVDYEAELAVVIGKTASYVSQEEAKGYVLGYTCLNDVTARDLQNIDSQWTRAKGFDTFAPVGPWIETDIDPDNADIKLRLNGELKQSSNTSNFIFKTDYLISKISEIMTLYPGDIITTGTPSGIGSMHDGDVVEVEVGGIGILRNKCRAKQPFTSQL